MFSNVVTISFIVKFFMLFLKIIFLPRDHEVICPYYLLEASSFCLYIYFYNILSMVWDNGQNCFSLYGYSIAQA